MPTKKPVIGLSVRYCVLDMARGHVRYGKVTKIVGATKCETPEDWNDLIERYKKGHWGVHGARAERILRKLLAEGKIEQPRIMRNQSPQEFVYSPSRKFHHTSWVSSEDEIHWKNC